MILIYCALLKLGCAKINVLVLMNPLLPVTLTHTFPDALTDAVELQPY